MSARHCEANASLSSTTDDVLPGDPGPLQRRVGGLDRRDPEHVRVDRGHTPGDDPGQRLAADRLSARLVRQQRRPSPIVERRRVPGCDRAALGERGLELGELLERGVTADVLVTLELGARNRDDPLVVEPAIPCGGSALMAAERKRVLRLTGDRVQARELLGACPERDRPLLGHPRVDHPPAEGRGPQLLVLARERALGLQHHPRCAAHRLDAADDDDRGVAGLDRAARLGRGFEARRAQAVDRGPGHARRQPIQQPGHPGDVAVVLAGLVGVAEQDVVDPLRIEPRRAVEQRADGMRAEVVRPHGRETSAIAPEWSSDRIDNVRRAHL